MTVAELAAYIDQSVLKPEFTQDDIRKYIQEGIDFGCVCPECLYRCRACMGTNTVVSREDLRNLTFVDHTAEHEAQEEAGDGRREPLRPEDFTD